LTIFLNQNPQHHQLCPSIPSLSVLSSPDTFIW
jgi:hypothetical protein